MARVPLSYSFPRMVVVVMCVAKTKEAEKPMTDIISDLYYGNIQPNIRTCKKGSEEARLNEIFSDSEDWLTEHLEGRAKATPLNLLNAHSELDGIVSYENFRRGFVLGAQLVLTILNSEEGDEE